MARAEVIRDKRNALKQYRDFLNNGDFRKEERLLAREQRGLESLEFRASPVGSIIESTKKVGTMGAAVLKPVSIQRKQVRFIQRNPVSQASFSKGQLMLRELFHGERTFGTGQNLPKINKDLISGSGLIKNEDEGETGRMFGLG